MIALRCINDGKAFNISIENKIVNFYLEGSCFQLFPPNIKDNINKILMSRNKIPAQMISLINLTPNEIKEGQDAKDDTEMYNIIIRDIKSRGAKVLDEKRT